MPIYSIQGPDGNTYSIEGPAGASRADVIQAIQRQMAQQRAQEVAAAPQVAPPPAAPSTQRTIGEAILDIPAAGLSGLGGLLQFPGQLVKLVPGLSGLGEVLEKPGELVSGAGDYLKSEGLKARQALQSKAISDAEKDGILSQFATAITSTIKDPALLTTFVAEQVPLLLGPLSAAKVAQKIGAKSIESAGAGLTGKAAEEAVRVAAQRVNKKAATAAYGTGSAMQAADVSSDAYDQAYKQAIEQGLSEDEALRVAANAGRVAGAGAGVVSLLAQRLPGAMAIEKRLAGVPGTQGRIASGFGEALGESLEEGGGQLFKNLGLRQVNPEQPLLEGVGGAAGLGALGGGLLGTALGRKAEEPRFEGQQEGESDRQFAARLQQEIAAGIRPPAPPAPPPQEPPKIVLPGDQQLFTLAAQPNGYGMLENLKQRLIQNASIPEDQKKPVIENIRSIQERMNIETVDRLRPMGQPPAPLLPTDEEAQKKATEMDLSKLGTIVENMGKSIPAYQAVLADPEALKKEAKKEKLSVEEAQSRYQQHIEYINSVLPVYTQVLQQRKQQQQQAKEAEKAQAIANLTPEQQAIRSQAESLIKELRESGVPEFVASAEGFQFAYNNNNFKTEKDIDFLKSKVESYRNLKQSAEAAKPVDEISLESLNKNYPDDLAKIQEASKDPRLADLFARVNDVMGRSAKAVNALGMSWGGIGSSSPLDIQNISGSVSALGGGVGRLVNIKQAIDKNYNRATNDPAKLEQAIRDVEADIETANQRIAKVQALAPAAPPAVPAPAAAPVQEKVVKVEGPKPKGMPVRAKELPQPAAPISERQKQIAEMQKDVGRAERQRNAIINKSQSLWSVLVGKLNEQEVNDINPERRFKVLRAKKGVKAGESISTFVANGDMDPWLPPDRRLGATNYDEYDNTEYIKDLLRGGRENYITHDTKMEVEKLFGSISELDRAIRELLTIEEANEAINTAFNEQRGTAEETGPTTAEIEDRGVAPQPERDETGKIVRKSLAKVTAGVPPGKFRELERRAKAAPEPKAEEPKAEEPKPEEPKAEEPKPTISPEIQKKIETLGRVLQKNLAKFGLKGIDLNLEQGMADEGSFSGQLIRIALDAQDPLGILRHESIHALKEANFFTDKQWATLERMADQQWIDQYLKGQQVDYEGQVMSRYDAYMKEYAGNMALIREEAIADAFRNFSKKQPAGLMGALTTRMKNFFKAVKSAFNSQGFESAEDIFGKIEEGKLEAAAPAKITEAERKSLRGAEPEDLKNSLSEMRISPRYPTAAKATEDPMGDVRLQPDLNTFKQNRQSFIFNVGLMNRYPNFRGMRGSADDRVEQMILQMQDNLTWLYNHWKPNFRERSRLWYVGGNRISHRWAKRYDMPPEKVAGVIAALSPQKGWFANVSIAERMLDAVVNNADTKWDDSMSDVLRSREWGNKLSKVLKYSPVEQLARFEGKTLREIYRPGDQASLLDMAVWIRAWDEAKNPQVSRVITPEGRFTNDLEMTEDGSRPMPLRAQGFGPMTRALMVLQARNREDISLAIGDFDKVRSFYNNIISPYNNDDVTIDTHAVAAALLRPLGSSDLEVSHNFGSAPEDKSERAMSNSSITGLHGSYSVYAEAYRRAARDLGVLPRELQSITWEAVRGLFRPGQKVGAKERANQIWRQVASGAINANEARREISKLVGGIEDPAWTRSPVGSNEAARDSSYQGKLPGVGQPSRPEGRGGELPAGTQVERKSLRAPETEAFKKWFGGSKVVDENGEPMVMYHGTTADFDVFDTTRRAIAGEGAFFSSSPMGSFAAGPGGNIMPVYLSIKNPKVIDLARESDDVFKDRFIKQGHDGVVMMFEGKIQTAVAFYPEQIKSATGNIGTFEPTSPDIRKSLRQPMATWTDKRIDRLINEYGYTDGRTKAYAASVNPADFVLATTGSRESAERIYKEAGKLDLEELSGETQTPFLFIETSGKDWKIVGHEGRHRMAALSQEGITKVPVVLVMYENGSRKPSMYERKAPMEIEGQDFGKDVGVGDYLYAWDLIPLSYKYKEKLKEKHSSGDIRFSLRSKIGLYSELENKVEGVSAKAAPAGQWKTMINAMTQKGVKPEEIEWSGVNDWLDLQEGRVSKDDLLNYLRENGVQVGETVLGEMGLAAAKRMAAQDIAETIQAGLGYFDEDARDMLDRWRNAQPDSTMERQSAASLEEMLREAGDLRSIDEYVEEASVQTSSARYRAYTIPGGQNYREVLLTLPTDFSRKSKALEGEIRALGITDDLEDISPRDLMDAGASSDLINRFRDALKGSAEKTYSHSHWDQDNVLAHVRVNDRTDADGNKVLFVEEIQSDWGQEGKKRGFYDPKDVGTREEYLAAKSAAADVIKRTDNLGFDFWSNALNAIRESAPNWRNNFSFDSEEDARIIDEFLLAEARELRRIGRGQSTGIPAAPFVTKTEGWLNLALKRIMVMAAEGGYDKVAFVNGEQSAKRYDLSKQIDRIDANRRGKDSYEIDVSTKEGKDFNRSGLSSSDLEDQVGKEMAQKIIDATTEQDKPVRFSGLDLKVGGEGMKTFYDQIVPQAVKKLLPKVGGGQMGAVEVGVAGLNQPKSFNAIRQGAKGVVQGTMPNGEVVYLQKDDTWGSEAGAKLFTYLDDAYAAAAALKDKVGVIKQPGFDITPAMREKVETTGLPKFSLRSRPFVDPVTEARIDATIIAAPRESLVDRMIDAISPKTFSRLREEFIVTYNELAEVDKRVAAQIRAAGGKEQLADERAESAALLSDQAAAVASSALGAHNRKGGIPVYRNGIVTVDTSGDNEGPVVIFSSLASTGDPKTFRDYQFWASVNRSKKYMLNPGQTRYVEQVFEKEDIDRAEQLRRDYAAQGIDFNDIRSRWLKYNNGLVKLMRDTGGISDRAARDFVEHADYFPFFRQIGEEDMAGPKAFSTIAGTKPPKAAKGGEAPLGDFFETVVRNTQAAITLAMKNVAAQRATSQALRINEVVRLSESPQIVQTSATTWDVMDSQYIDTVSAADQAAAEAIARRKFGPTVTVSASTRAGDWNVFKAVKIGDVDAADAQEARQLAYDNHKYRPDINVYKVLEHGQPVYYRAADIKFINAIKALNMADLPFIGLLSAPSNLLRTLVTKDPGYMLVNQMRDSLSAWQTSGVKMTPFIDSARQFAKSVAKTSPEMEALFNAGVIGGYEYAHGQRESGKFLEKEIRRKAGVKSVTEKITTPFTSLWGALERGTQVSDGATRAEVYKRVLAETGNEAEAIWQAAEVLNFYRHGRNPIIRVLTAAVPFLNSRIQGLDVLYRAGMRPAFDKMATDEQRKRMKTFWVRGMTMFATTFMYWLLTHDDDEYKKQEQETRDNYWLIPSLGIKIAIPFEVGVIFKVLPERLFQSLAGNDTAKDTMDSLKRQLESTLMFSIIPQAVAPYIEVTRNFSSFTQRPIIGQGLENVAPRFQVAPGTSSFAQVVANTLQIETTADSSAFTKGLSKSLEISPVKLDHLIKGYTGTLGQYAVEVFDAIYNLNADVPKPSKRFEQLPVIKRLALDPNARGNVTAYYDLKNAVDEVVRTSNLLERTMNYDAYAPYLRANIGLLANKQYISALEKSMKEFREMKILIRNSKMDSNAKEKAILAVEQMENQLTSNIQQVKVAANR